MYECDDDDDENDDDENDDDDDDDEEEKGDMSKLNNGAASYVIYIRSYQLLYNDHTTRYYVNCINDDTSAAHFVNHTICKIFTRGCIYGFMPYLH